MKTITQGVLHKYVLIFPTGVRAMWFFHSALSEDSRWPEIINLLPFPVKRKKIYIYNLLLSFLLQYFVGVDTGWDFFLHFI